MVKPESLQRTGSFKARGAFNAVLSLVEREPRVAGVVTHSSLAEATYATPSVPVPSFRHLAGLSVLTSIGHTSFDARLAM